jgi:twinkle protein
VWRAQKDESEPDDTDKPDAKLELKKQRNGDVQNYSQWLWFNKGAMQFRARKSALRSVSYVPFSNSEREAA